MKPNKQEQMNYCYKKINDIMEKLKSLRKDISETDKNIHNATESYTNEEEKRQNQ